MIKKIIFILFFVSIFLRPALQLKQDYKSFFGKGYMDNYENYKKLYDSSQYVKKQNPSIIPDGDLEIFAAESFLKGLNPILIVHDQPPLGRYIVAVSLALFDNPNITVLLCLFFSGLGVYLIAKKTVKNTIVSLIPVSIFVNEPLFFSKFIYIPLLEPIQLPFIIFSVYFFMLAAERKKLIYFLLTSLFLGLVISTRFFVLGLIECGGFIAYLLLQKDFKSIKKILLTLPLAVLVLIISYTKTILDGSSILHIIGIQKYIFFYHQEQLTLPFTFWDLLLFNRWHTWWGSMSITHDSQWIVLWPISSFIIIFYFILAILRKVKYTKPELIILTWIGVYSLLLSLGNASTRYFLPLTPFLYILATSHVFTAYTLIKKKKSK